MIKDRYKNKIKNIISKYIEEKDRVFIFGSSVRNDKYNDIDVGILASENRNIKIYLINEELENSTIPYKIDVIDFNKVEDDFKNEIFKNEIVWII